MDFNDTPEEAEFRAGARAFLDRKPSAETTGAGMVYRAGNEDPEVAGEGVAGARRPTPATPASPGRRSRADAAARHPAGDLRPGRSEVRRAAAAVLHRARHVRADGVAPGARQAKRDRYVPTALRGEEIWCQLFSEPGAGSDLAGLRTRAERDGDDWIVNGQKVWTTGAQYSDFGMLLRAPTPTWPSTRASTYVLRRHEGAGRRRAADPADVRRSHFNEVFFTDVRIPDSQRLGGGRATAGTSR